MRGPGKNSSLKRLRDLGLLLICRPDRLIKVGWWWLSGKRVRARHRLEKAISTLPFAHQRWMTDVGNDDVTVVASLRSAHIIPSFCVHIHISEDDDTSLVRRAIRSALRQSQKPVCVIVTSSSNSNRPMARSGKVRILSGRFRDRMAGLRAALCQADELAADYIVPLSTTDALPKHAIVSYAAFGQDADNDLLPLLFGDQKEYFRLFKRANAWLKPAWDPRMILSQDYVSDACALPVHTAIACIDENEPVYPQTIFDLVLQMSLQEKIGAPAHHVERITVLTPAGGWRRNAAEKVLAVQRFVGGRGTVSPGPFGTVRLRWPMPTPPPKISVVIATRDRVELLRTSVSGVLNETDYANLELIIADNDSREVEALDYMDHIQGDPRVTVVRWPHPFNYSAINNFASRSAKGDYICLLNNDIEVIQKDWLSELVREAVQPGVGVVGARLLYPDRSIQHAGVAIGIGNAAGHAHRGLPDGSAGYFAQALIPRGATAVTGACLLISKSNFVAVGGLDETAFPVAYNDVDLCLKIRALGLSNIYVPAATLIHHESKSRGLGFSPEQIERYMRELASLKARWCTGKVIDAWHHARLDRTSETY